MGFEKGMSCMETYIVRQPILDDTQKIVGYEILYQQDESSFFSNQSDSTAANAIDSFLTQVNDDKFLEGKTAFITFTPNLLLKNIPKMFSPDKLVIQIEDNSIIHPLAQKIIYRYKKQGYRIAVEGFEFSPRYFGILDVVDIIKLNFAEPNNPSLANVVNIGMSFQKEIVAYNVNTEESYKKAKELKCKYMEGTCVADQSSSKVHRVDHMQSNFFQLMISITKDEPDIDEITQIISRDVTLAFSLMKLVNSAYFALRNRAKSVKQALIILGLGQLKQWIYLLSFKHESGDLSEQLIKTSFLRANFCAELLPIIPGEMPISKNEAYLLGMFSTVGQLLEVSLDSALSELGLSEEIKVALTTGEGSCGELYHLVLCYERADWPGMTKHAQALNMPINLITQKYFECVEYVNVTWQNLTAPYDGDDDPSTGIDEGLEENKAGFASK